MKNKDRKTQPIRGDRNKPIRGDHDIEVQLINGAKDQAVPGGRERRRAGSSPHEYKRSPRSSPRTSPARRTPSPHTHEKRTSPVPRSGTGRKSPGTKFAGSQHSAFNKPKHPAPKGGRGSRGASPSSGAYASELTKFANREWRSPVGDGGRRSRSSPKSPPSSDWKGFMDDSGTRGKSPKGLVHDRALGSGRKNPGALAEAPKSGPTFQNFTQKRPYIGPKGRRRQQGQMDSSGATQRQDPTSRDLEFLQNEDDYDADGDEAAEVGSDSEVVLARSYGSGTGSRAGSGRSALNNLSQSTPARRGGGKGRAQGTGSPAGVTGAVAGGRGPVARSNHLSRSVGHLPSKTLSAAGHTWKGASKEIEGIRRANASTKSATRATNSSSISSTVSSATSGGGANYGAARHHQTSGSNEGREDSVDGGRGRNARATSPPVPRRLRSNSWDSPRSERRRRKEAANLESRIATTSAAGEKTEESEDHVAAQQALVETHEEAAIMRAQRLQAQLENDAVESGRGRRGARNVSVVPSVAANARARLSSRSPMSPLSGHLFPQHGAPVSTLPADIMMGLEGASLEEVEKWERTLTMYKQKLLMQQEQQNSTQQKQQQHLARPPSPPLSSSGTDDTRRHNRESRRTASQSELEGILDQKQLGEGRREKEHNRPASNEADDFIMGEMEMEGSISARSRAPDVKMFNSKTSRSGGRRSGSRERHARPGSGERYSSEDGRFSEDDEKTRADYEAEVIEGINRLSTSPGNISFVSQPSRPPTVPRLKLRALKSPRTEDVRQQIEQETEAGKSNSPDPSKGVEWISSPRSAFSKAPSSHRSNLSSKSATPRDGAFTPRDGAFTPRDTPLSTPAATPR